MTRSARHVAFALSLAVLGATGRSAAADPGSLFLDEGPARAEAPPPPVARVPVVVDLSPYGTVVLTGDELIRRGYRSLGEALADVAGIDRHRTTMGVRYGLRGVPDGLALVVDGVRLVVDGERDLLDVDQTIGLDDVERVEVVRGPATATTGVSALVGVVRVTTRRPGLTGAAARLSRTIFDGGVGEGEVFGEGTLRAGIVGARASVRWREGPAQDWRLRAVPTRFERIGAAVVPTTKQNVRAAPGDDDGLLLRLALDVEDVLVDASYADATVLTPISSFSHGLVLDDPQRRERRAARLRALWRRHLGPVHVEAGLWGARHARVDHVPLYPRVGVFREGGAIDVESEATTAGAQVRADVPLGRDHRVVLGLFGDLTRLDARSTSTSPVAGDDVRPIASFSELSGNASGAVEYQGDFGLGLHLTAGLVGEWRTAFPAALAPRVALVWMPSPLTSLRLSYAEGVRAPDRFDMAALTQAVIGDGIVGVKPNLELRPERVRMLEAGFGLHPSSALHLSLDAFALRHEDALALERQGALLVPVNAPVRHLVGVEAGGRVDALPRWLSLGARGSHAATVDGPSLGVDGLHLVVDAISRPLPGLEAGARARLRARPGDDAAAGAYSTIDLFGSYEIDGGALRLLCAAGNVLDGDVPSRDLAALPVAADVALPSPGRHLHLGIEGRL